MTFRALLILLVMLLFCLAANTEDKPHFQLSVARCDLIDGKLANCQLYPGHTWTEALQETVDVYSVCDDAEDQDQ